VTRRTVDHGATTLGLEVCDECGQLVWAYTELGLIDRFDVQALSLREEGELLLAGERTYNIVAGRVSLRGGIHAFMAHGDFRPGAVVRRHPCEAGSTKPEVIEPEGVNSDVPPF
jgi:hypothetical protein